MKLHLMTDIETLDTKPTGVILSVAMVAFDPQSGEMETILNADMDAGQQVLEGRTVGKDTVEWWLQQDYKARRRAFAPDIVMNPRNVSDMIVNRVGAYPHLWANDPDFDYVFLQDFIRAYHPDFKWPFWKHRSVRTIKAFCPSIDYFYNVKAHDPLEDCKHQIAEITSRMRNAGLIAKHDSELQVETSPGNYDAVLHIPAPSRIEAAENADTNDA